MFGDANDKPVALPVISRAWAAALQRCGLAYRKPYSLRHGFAGICLERGMSLQETAAVLGHSSIQMLTSIYATISRKPSSLAKLESLGAE